VSSQPADFPSLAPEHVRGARLFADREHLISSLPVPKGGVIAEIGVARGDFSEFLISQLRPSKSFAFDNFPMHTIPIIWGIPSAEYFDGLTHVEFYKRRFKSYGDMVVIEEGLSHISLARYTDRMFDLIYIDAGHDYENVKRDAELSKRILKDSGILVFNDYIMFDHFMNSHYGVVPAVNELVVNDGWRVIGFALSKQMFCDIAIQKDPPIFGDS